MRGILKVVVGLAVTAVALVALVGQAVRGNAVVDHQRTPTVVHDANLDDAYYRCLDVQAHSLVSPGEPVVLAGSLGDWVTLNKAVASWVTIASSRSTARLTVSLRDHVTGRPACLDTVVVAVPTNSRHGTTVLIGKGASVPGAGPPPSPQL